MKKITVEELEQWRKSGKEFVLLDVRGPQELAVASLPEAVNLPIYHLAARLGELDREAEIVLLCHMGGRAEVAARFLMRNGFTNVYPVEGGIDAYAERIDPTIARYDWINTLTAP